MHAPFFGFGPGAIDWFRGLEAENSKARFEATRAVWEADVRGPLERLLEELAAEIGGAVKLFRPHRDVRFSKDKSPYKTNTYGVIRVPGTEAGLYASVSSRGFFAGSGYWQMASDQLERYRAAVQGPDGPALAAAVEAMKEAGLALEGAALRSAPRGVPRDHPLIGLLRLKDVLAGAAIGPAETLDGRRPLDHARRVWEATRPAMGWMDAHVGASAIPPEVRFGRG